MDNQHKCPEAPRVRAFLEGALGESQQAALASHLKTCGACRAHFDELADSFNLLSEAAKEVVREQAEPDEALNKMVDQLRTEGPGGGDDAGEITRELSAAEPVSLDFLEPADRPELLGRLGTYEITEVVGQGGMGIVLKGHDTRLNRCVAVKVLAPALATNPTARKRFMREARAGAAVSHDHVVTIHAVDESADPPFLVMAYVEGVSLDQRIKTGGPLELTEILRIGMQAASGLAAAHAQGLVHRDIKPSNILLENGVERVKITDFGLARAADDVHFTQTGVIAGTPEYMSPEQARGEPTDHRSDLFNLGCVLYAMCTGRSPFRAETVLGVIHRVCDDDPRSIRQVNTEIPNWMVQIIDRLLQKEPEARFQSAEEVADLLGRHLAHLQQPSLTAKPEPLAPLAKPGKQTRGGKRSRWLVGAAAAVLLLVGFALTEATGLTNVAEVVAKVFRVETSHGTLIVKIDDANVKVTVDENGETITLTGIGEHEIKLRPGRHAFEAAKAGRILQSDLLTITRGDRRVVTVGPEPYRPTPGAVDLLALVDPDRDALGGDWKLQDGRLITWGDFSQIRMPYWLPEEYDVITTVKRVAGEKNLGLSLWVQGRLCWASIDAAPAQGCVSGVSALKAGRAAWVHTDHRGQLLPLGREVTVRYAVRQKEGKPSIQVDCDGTTAIDWEGTPEETTAWEPWPMWPAQIGGLMVVGQRGAFHFTRLEIVPHSDGGRACFSDPAGKADRPVAERVCWNREGTLWGSVDGAEPAKVDRRYPLPPSFALTRVDVKHPSALVVSDFSLEGLTSLEAMSLRGQRTVPVTVIDSMKGCSSLRELDLGFTDVTDEGLARLMGLAKLRRLVLTGTAITDAGCAHLGGLTNLEELELSGTKITNGGLASLRKLQALRRLGLDNTPISDHGLAELAHLPKLSSLSLAYTGVSEDGLAPLRELKSLADVSLVGTRVTDADLESLAEDLPDCRIEHHAGPAVDLLELVEPESDSVRGQWQRDGDALVSPDFEHANLRIPYVPPEEYLIRAVVRRQSGKGPVWLGVVQQGRQTAFQVDSWPTEGYMSGLDAIDGVFTKGNPSIVYGQQCPAGQDVSILVTVRKRRITAACADRLILDWSGDPARLGLYPDREVPKKDALFVGANTSQFRFSELRLMPISRRGPASGESE